MSDCRSIDLLVTPYVDGEIAPADREVVDGHLRVCPPCHTRIAAERAVRDLIVRCKPGLGLERASSSLRARCEPPPEGRTEGRGPVALPASAAAAPPVPAAAAVAPPVDVRRQAAWRARLAPLALAATVVLIVGGSFTYVATERSSRVMAAELTADHVKCFALNSLLGTRDEAAAVEQSMLSGFGWHMRFVERFEETGLRLVGARPCLYGRGKVAHIMFRHEGRPVSVFMLPKAVRDEEVIDVMGHQATVWSADGRTFVMIARERRAEAAQMASIVRAALR